jgi:hypothetical protein
VAAWAAWITKPISYSLTTAINNSRARKGPAVLLPRGSFAFAIHQANESGAAIAPRVGVKTSLLIGLALLAGVAGRIWWRSHSTLTERAKLEAVASSSPIIVEDEAIAEKTRIGEKVGQLLNNRDYRGLDLLADKLRADKQTFAPGTLPIEFFFSWFGDLRKGLTAEECELHIQSLRDWFTADPDSITPRIALAEGLLAYAWQARGHEFADKVTEEGWRLFNERVTEARRILNAAERMTGKCQIFFEARLRVALMDGTSRERYDRYFEEAVRAFPAYQGFYMKRTNYLLPRWHGEPGEWEAFTAASADRIGGEEGDIFYARIVWNMRNSGVYDNIFEDSKAQWPRTQRGFEAICRRYPESVAAASEYCDMSGLARARDVTKHLFARLDNRVDLTVWRTVERWEQARRWAFFVQ